jgi:hypothetical protein
MVVPAINFINTKRYLTKFYGGSRPSAASHLLQIKYVLRSPPVNLLVPGTLYRPYPEEVRPLGYTSTSEDQAVRRASHVSHFIPVLRSTLLPLSPFVLSTYFLSLSREILFVVCPKVPLLSSPSFVYLRTNNRGVSLLTSMSTL